MENSIVLTSEEEAFILSQIQYLHTELVSIQQAFLGIISVSIGAYALVLYYAFTTKGPGKLIFIILPFLFSLSLYNILKFTIKMLGIDAYIRYLETLINLSHKKILFAWQSFLIYANGYSVLGVIPQIPCSIALFALLIYKYIQTINTLNISLLLIIPCSCLLVVQILFILLMLYHAVTHYSVVLRICQTSLNSVPSVDLQELLHTEYPPYVKKLLGYLHPQKRKKQNS